METREWLQLAITDIKESICRIERHLEAQNSRLRKVETGQAKVYAVASFIAVVAAIVIHIIT